MGGGGTIIDFVVGLPPTIGVLNSTCVVVDQLTKSTHFIPVKVKYIAAILAQLYISQIMRLHRVPISVMSDHGSLFTSYF